MALYQLPSNIGLDLKSRRGESSETSGSSKRKRRKAGSDDDDDWVPGVEEVPRRSRRGKEGICVAACACPSLPVREMLYVSCKPVVFRYPPVTHAVVYW